MPRDTAARPINSVDEYQQVGTVAGVSPARRAHARRGASDAPDAAGRVTAAGQASGVAHEEIIEHADCVGADLVVMGTRGWTAAGETFLGSTTDRVLRRAVQPVLTLR